MTSADVDNTDNAFTPSTVSGANGDFNIDSSGQWTFTANSAFNQLNVGDKVEETFTVSSVDGTPSTIKVTINGTNDQATVSSVTVSIDETDKAVITSGTLTSTDVDNPDNTFTPDSISGTNGNLTIDANGHWVFTANSAFNQLNVGDKVEETFTVSSVDGTPSTIKVTINGTNDVATVSSATVAIDETDKAVTTSGTLTSTDVDNPDNTFTPDSIVGSNGDLTIDANGHWTFTANSAFNQLNVGDKVEETFTISSIDGTPSTIKVAINGTNDKATVSSATVAIDETDKAVTTSGTLTSADVDNPDNAFTPDSITGSNGNLNIDADGHWNFTANSAFNQLNVGDKVEETFTVSSIDGTPSTIKVTINGTNDKATVSSATVAINETDKAVTTSGTLTSTDIDNTDNAFTPDSISGTNGNLTIDANGHWVFTANSAFNQLNVDDKVEETFTVNSIDGTPSTIKVTINGTNDKATVSSATVVVDETDTAVTTSGTLTSTDVDNPDNTFTPDSISGTNGDLTIGANGQWTFTANSAFNQLNVGDKVEETFTVSSVDGTSSTIKVTINGTNDKAAVSTATVSVGETDKAITTSGTITSTDVDNPDNTFTPDSISGTNGDLTIDANGQWTFTANSAFNQLNVGDKVEETFIISSIDGTPSTIKVTINGTNDKPTIAAQSHSVTEDGQLLQGQMAGTDIDDGAQLTYSVANPVDGLTLNKDGSYSFDPSNSTYQHLADKQTQTLTIPVTITDEHNSSSTENLTITITGTGDAAIIGGVDTGSVIEKTAGDNMSPDFAHSGMATLGNSVLYADGQLTIVDADKGEQGFASHTNAYNYHGTYGDLILNPDGSWHYVADAGSVSHIGGRPTTRGTAIDQLGKGDTLTDTITVHSIDGTTHDIVITINGSNDRPYCSSKVQLNSGKEDLAQTITATELLANTIDVDSNDLGKLTVANLHADHGSILDNQDGTYTFTPTKDYNGQIHFSYDVTDAHGGTTHTGASTTLTATPDGAIISEVTTDHVTEDGSHSSHNAGVTTELANGRLQVVDPDSGENKFQYSQFGESAVHDPFGGMLRIDSMGNWGYSVNNANLQHLAQGQTETVIYRVHSYDGTAYELHIDVVGTNDAPTVTQVALSNGTEDTHYQMQASQFGFTDVDTGDTLHSIAITDIPPATQGKFVLDGHDITAGQHIPTADISKLQFVPAQNFNGDVQFKYTVNDGHTDSTEATNTLHFDAVGDVAVITGTTTGDVDEGHGSFGNMSPDYAQPGMAKLGQSALTADGKLDIVDPDTGESQFDSKGGAWNNSYHGQYGHLLLNTDGTWHYDVTVGNVDWVGNRKTTVGTTIDELGENQTLTDTITIYSKDGTAHDIVITIHGDNDRPYISSEVTLATGTEDTAQTLTTADLLTNTVDVDANDVGKLSIENLVSDHGSLLDNKDGTFTFTPEKDYNGTVHFSYDVKDAHGGVTHTGATTTFVAVQDNAIISGVDTGSVTENTAGKDMSPDHAQPGMSHLTGAMLYADGKLSISDPDAGENEFDTNQVGSQGYTYHGSYGQLILNADGSWHYNVNAGSQNNGVMPGTVGTAIDKLGDGESLTDTITIRAKDGTTHDIVITIHGSNDRPYCSSEVQLHSGKEDTAQTLTTADLLANTVDVDANDASQLSIANLVSDHGVVIDNKDGTFTFNPDKDYNGQVHFTYDVKDAHGGITHTGATTTLAAVNDAALFSVDDTGSVKEDVHVQGDSQHTVAVSGVLIVSDPDAGESEFVANRNVHAVSDPFGGDLSIGRAGDWTYSVSNNNLNRLAEGEKHQVTYEVVSRGGDKHQIVITVVGTNDDHDPILSVTQTTPTTGTLTETDVDVKDTHTFSVVSSTGQFGSISVDPDSGAYVYTANSSVAGMAYNKATHTYHGTDVFEVKVADNHGGESSTFITFDTNGHISVVPGQQPTISTSVLTNPLITAIQPSLPTGTNTPPNNGVTVDLITPSDTGKSNTDNVTKETTPTITGHTDIPYSQVTIYDGSTPIGHAVSDASGQYSAVVSNLTDGDHNLSAKALAPSSSIPATSSLLSVHVDTVIAPLTIALTHDTGSSNSDLVTHDGALTIGGQEVGATVEYSTDSGHTWTSSFTPQQGSNSVNLRQTDTAGNVSANTSLNFTLDNSITPPTVSLAHDTGRYSTNTPDLITKDSQLSIQTEAGAKVEYSNDGGHSWSSVFNPVEGVNNLQVRQTDIAGNLSPVTHFSFTLDTTPGTVTVNPISQDNALNATENNQPLVITGTTSNIDPGDVVYVVVGNNHFYDATVKSDGSWSLTLSASVHQNILASDHDYPIQVGTVDTAGNSTPRISTQLLIDTQNPIPHITVDSVTQDNVLNALESGQSIPITGTVTGDYHAGDTVSLKINGANILSLTGTVDASGHFSIPVDGRVLERANIHTSYASGQAAPIHSIEATIQTTDAVGNTGSATTGSQVFTVDTQIHVAIQTDPITADNVINAQESNSSVDITGGVSGDFNVGDIVTLNVNGAQHTGAVDSQGHYSIAVPGSELTADADQKIEASIAVTDSAGNSTHTTTDVVYQVDTQVSVPTITFENTGADNLYSKAEIARGHANTITATVTPPGDAKIGEHLVVNGQDHVLDAHTLQHGIQIEVHPGSNVQATMTDEHGNTAGSQGFAASAIPEPIVVRPPSGSHQVSGTLGIPPQLPSLTPVPTTQHGWRIHLPNGQYVTSHHGQYGTLTIDPQTGNLHYQEQANVHTGPHGSASGIGQHEDKFEVALQGTNQDEVVAHVNIQILSHGPGHSGKLNIGTEVVDMTITPIAHSSHPAPPPPPPVQHDEPDMASQADFTVTLSDDSNLDLTQQTHQEPDEKTSHHGAAAYLDALGIKPDATSTTVHDQPADMDIVLAQVDHQDATTHDQAHLDMSDALEHHDANINHNQDDEHHHHDIDGLPDIDPNS
ncbi:VCBS domain-containing protein [Vibrio echinoideorum]